MVIPKASINDLIATHNSAASAQPTGQSSNPISDFIGMLGKYAQQGAGNIGNGVNKVLDSPMPSWATHNPLVPQGVQQDNQPQPSVRQYFDPSVINPIPTAQNFKDDPVMSTMGLAMLGMGGVEGIKKGNPEEGLPGAGEGGLPSIVQKAKTQGMASLTPEEKATLQSTPIETTRETVNGAAPGALKNEEAATGQPAQKPSMITKNQADPQTIAKMSLNFDVPRRIAQNQMVKPETVMNQLIDDGISGRNLNDLQNTADSITGEKGAFPQINNHILKNIKAPIDYGDALTAKNTNLPSVMAGEKEGFINTINNEVSKAMEPLNYNKPGQLPSTLPEGHAYASDLFQTSQNLRNISRMYMRKAYTDMGELNHPEMERAANAINEIKNNIDDAIDKNVPPSTYQAFKNDPYVQQQLQRVPQTVANRWLNGADRFKDGQTIQAPYVNLSHMIEDTKDTQLSVWTKAAKAMQSQNVSGNVANTVKENIPGPKILKNAVGGIVGAAAKPFDKTPEDIFQENMSGKGTPGGGKIPGGKLTKNIAIAGGLTAAGVGLEAMQKGSNANSQNGTDKSDNGHNGNIANTPLSVNSQLETDMSKVKPDSTPSDPRTITGSDGKSLAMSDGQYQTATAALDALVKQDPSYITNPIKAGQLAKAQHAIETKYSASQKLMNSYQKVSTVSQKIADAQSLLKETSPVLTDKIGFLEGGHEMLDPKYQSLVNDLNFIENSDPRLKGQLSNLATGGSVKTALDNAAKLLLSEHNQLLKSYGAGTPETTSAKATTPSQIPAGLPAPVDGALPPMHTGSYQFTAPNPMFQ